MSQAPASDELARQPPPGRLMRVAATAALTALAFVRDDDLPPRLRPLARTVSAGVSAALTAMLTRRSLPDFGQDPESSNGRRITVGLAAGAFGVDWLTHGFEQRAGHRVDAFFGRFPRVGTALLVGAVTWEAMRDLEPEVETPADPADPPVDFVDPPSR